MTLSPTWIGIDVSKAWIDVADPSCARIARIANCPAELAQLAASLAARNEAAIFEATGTYDTALRHALATAGVAHVRVNPQRARDFARATGRLAKTDAIDAAMLAQMGRALQPQPDPLPDQERERLVLLTRRRDQLVAMRMQEKTRRADVGADADDGTVAVDLDSHIAWLDEAVAKVEKTMRQLLDASASLARADALVRSMPGIGPVTSAVLIGLLPELGVRSGKQLAMLAGLAPLNNDSGDRRGRRTIRGGRRRVRQALYMAAVASLKTNSPLKAFYNRLRSAGKAPKAALIALARKMLTTLNAMAKTQTAFRA